MPTTIFIFTRTLNEIPYNNPMTMKRILTLNTWGDYGPDVRERWRYLCQNIRTLSPDIACFQEVFTTELADLIAESCGFQSFFYPNRRSGLMIASKSSICNTGLLSFSQTSETDSVDRQCICAEFDFEGRILLITNTHLSWKPYESQIRKSQLAEIADLIRERQIPSIMCGDYNCTFEADEFSELKQSGVIDTMTGFQHQHLPTWDNKNPYIQSHRTRFPDRRVDLILLSASACRDLKVESSEIVFTLPNSKNIYVSDHYGVSSVLRLNS